MSKVLIDVETFRALQEAAGKDFVVELVATFLQEAPAMLAELRSAHAQGDADRFRRAAHSLKSNFNTFGAVALGARAREFEVKGLADSACNAAALDAFETAYMPVAVALKELAHG